MCSWRSFGVACVFAGWLGELSLSLNYLWSLGAKTMTPRGSPRREPGQPAPPLKVFHFDQKILAVRKANCIYRPVGGSYFISVTDDK